ncbi:unnamed protein product [Microthlaspi erraticum]|uniref:Reverse transcriptase domain-containing protein n=1 Tax=Microthlaspi erraticum TaxID=1685480 RepID=A0A6D2KQL8_9BRAS|nr:unnamed protein product [Microthlaspi erraticum]
MAKRLKKVLPSIVSESQAAFVQGRLISDNILVAHELLHALNSSNACSEEFIAIKTDISKAYDRVEWSFLENALRILGFDGKWIHLVMGCVKIVNYQVLINGKPYGDIKSTQGLRQGDPLSPYLFVICTEMLVRMMKKAEQDGKITGLQIARKAPPVSHLLFADDSMFYCKGSEAELNQIGRIIEEYSLASGQRVNYQKSSVCFGKKIPISRREEIKRKLGIEKEGGEGNYLGLPENFGKSKVETMKYLQERMKQRTTGWHSKFLSTGGKEVLRKSVAMALPTYTMMCFKLPKTTYDQITSALAEFWWRSNSKGNGMHWKTWKALCKPKEEGGLDFRDLEAYNLALLGKQMWRMMTRKDTLMARIFRGKYFPKSDPLQASLGSNPSYAWSSINAAQNLLKQGTRYVIGRGNHTRAWKDNWIDTKPARPPLVRQQVPDQYHHLLHDNTKVEELLVNNGREWNTEIVQNLFSREDGEIIERIRPGGGFTEDSFSWDFSRNGEYTVKSAYWLQIQIQNRSCSSQEVLNPSLNPLFQMLWKTEGSPKVQHFL